VSVPFNQPRIVFQKLTERSRVHIEGEEYEVRSGTDAILTDQAYTPGTERTGIS